MHTSARTSGITALAVLLPAIAMGGPALAVADPTPGGQPADQTIQELSGEGYTVAVNWVGGASSLPLSRCRVNAIHNPNRGVPALPNSSVTVYVDVQCPDDAETS